MAHHGFYFSATQVACTCRALLSCRTIRFDDQISEALGWRLAPLQTQVARLRAAVGMTEAQAHALAVLIWGAAS